jgi:DNA-binding transcriptional LysR family regulator
MNGASPALLPALRVFEAAARHLSFTKAAQELNVTQAAVSHQVRALEEQLGVSLFRRTTRRLALTRRATPAARGDRAFEILRRSVTSAAASRSSPSPPPSFGARWLAPRMGRFAERYPGIELSIRHTQTVLELGREGLDLAVRWGKGRWPGVESELIGPATRIVVGAPAYIRRLALKTPADIDRATLLHEDTREDWTEWLLVAGLDPALAQKGIVMDDDNALIQAAASGQGLALTTPSLVVEDIATGRLLSPFELALADGYGFYLVYEKDALARPKVAAFRAFLREEAAREEARPAKESSFGAGPSPNGPALPFASLSARQACHPSGRSASGTSEGSCSIISCSATMKGCDTSTISPVRNCHPPSSSSWVTCSTGIPSRNTCASVITAIFGGSAKGHGSAMSRG